MKISEWMKNSHNKKILICDNVKNGLRLIRQANREGVARFNVSAGNLKQLATELIMNDLAVNGRGEARFNYIDNGICSIIVNELLCENIDKFSSLIPEECVCLATADEMLSIMNQIRMNKHRASFENSKEEKVEYIKEFIALYEKRLADEGEYDYCSLLRRATELAVGNDYFSDCSFGVLDYLDFTSLEAEFLNKLTGDSHYDEIQYQEKSNEDNENHLSFFKAYGISSEVEHIVSDIEKRKAELGEVNVFYSNDVYIGYIRSAFESRNINYSIVSPYSATSLGIVGFMLGIINWAQSGYRLSELEGVVLNTKFDVTNALAKLDKAVKSGIGWGLERYEAYLDMFDKAENADDKEIKHRFNDFLSELVSVFIDYSGNVADLYKGLFNITMNFTKERNEEKRLVKENLKRLEKAFGEVKSALSLDEALELINQKLKALRINDDEKTNGVSVIKQGKVFVVERKYNYFIGLENELFYEKEIESPLLSDEELSKYLTGSIDLALDKNRKKENSVLHTMQTAKGAEFIFGCSVYDATEQREYATSYFYRNLAGKDFDAIKVYTYPDIVDYGININGDKVFGELEYDKKPEFRFPKTLSATTVKPMLECPLKFYYSCIENVPELNYDDSGRVDSIKSLHRGNLYHSVLEKYANSELKKQPTEIATSINRKVFDEIYEDAFEAVKRNTPCISPVRLEREKEELKLGLAEYIQQLHEEFSNTKREKNWQIEMCEYRFEDFVYTLNYGDKTEDITFTGKIDRVDSYTDASGNKHYRIVDYKTGKFSLAPKDCVSENMTNIQHSLYAMYMIKRGYAVDESGYITLDQKNENGTPDSLFLTGDEICDLSNRAKAVLAEVMIEKSFCKPEGLKCPDYCSYANICREKGEGK